MKPLSKDTVVKISVPCGTTCNWTFCWIGILSCIQAGEYV